MELSLQLAVIHLLTGATPECEQLARHVLAGQGESPAAPRDDIPYRGRVALAFSRFLPPSMLAWDDGSTVAGWNTALHRLHRNALAAAFATMSYDNIWLGVISAIAEGRTSRQLLLYRWIKALDRVPEHVLMNAKTEAAVTTHDNDRNC